MNMEGLSKDSGVRALGNDRRALRPIRIDGGLLQ
jgi:hypothetical protein